MSRAVVFLTSKANRERAARWCATAPDGTSVEFRKEKHSRDQQKRMWAMLGDISKQTRWHGSKLDQEDWKLLFLQALTSELRLVPNMAGDGFVPLGRSSSRLTKGEMSDMIELMYQFGAERGIVWSEPKEKAA